MGQARRFAGFSRLGVLSTVLSCGAFPCAAGTALTIHPPEGFVVRQTGPDSDEAAEYEVASVADPDLGCAITFTPAGNPGGPDQSGLNAEAAKPAYAARVRSLLEKNFDVTTVSAFSMQGADGAVILAVPLADPALRASVYETETPRGRLETLCVSAMDEFDAWRPVFEMIARGVELPR